MVWEAVIGLEIHAQLATTSKIFSGSPTTYGADPNTQASAVDLGLPGVLPVINQRAIEMAVSFGLAINAEICRHSIFARKNYFYPDLPKGYQISQYETPIVAGGSLEISVEGSTKSVRITRAHLEEDAGKSLHEGFQGRTAIDLNRAGTPLLEIVSEPDLRSAEEAVSYMREVLGLVKYLGICDGNMQEGSFRCDANVSVRQQGEHGLNTRTEIKNLNSFRFVQQAINYEIQRQIEITEAGNEITQETRLFDDRYGETRSMRSKEDAHDYRYFPDPDLLPITLSVEFIERLRDDLPELPKTKLARFVKKYNLNETEATILVQEPETARFFEAAIKIEGAQPKQVANWIIGDLFGAIKKSGLGIVDSCISPAYLGQLVARVVDNTISGKMAKEVFLAVWDSDLSPDQVIADRKLRQLSDSSALESIVKEVLSENTEQVEQYKSGKRKILGYLVGQVMKKTQGQASPKLVNTIIQDFITQS